MSDNEPENAARETRRKVLKKAAATIGGQTRTILIRDLSPRGALLKVDHAFSVGETLTILIEGYSSIEAEVRWAKGDRIGVQFHEAITLDDDGLPSGAKTGADRAPQSYVPWNTYSAQTDTKRPAINTRPKVFGRSDPKRPVRS